MSSSNSPCAACKFLRRKCTQECVFAPYFPADNPQRFACVHRVFGASNVAKLLNELSASQREDAVKSLAYEAEARLRDPVYGCVGFISALQQKLRQIQTEVYNAKKELSTYLSPQAMQALQTMFANPNMVEAIMANPAMIPSIGMVMPHQPNTGFPPYGNTNVAATPPLLVAAPHNQLVIRDAQQQELLEAQQLAAVQQQRELMLKTYEQQQQEFLRFGGFDTVVVGGGLNQMGGGGGGDGGGQPRLALGNFDNVSLHQIQQQQQTQGEQQHHLHAHVLHAHPNPLEAQQLLSPQQTFSQQQQPPQQQPQSEGGDRWSLNPSS